MNWKFIKQFPKYVIVIGVLVISTGLFSVWWWTRSAGGTGTQATASHAPVQDSRQEAVKVKVASLPAKMGWLALVGSDLYDISTGECLFPNWLNGIPDRLFYQSDTNKLMVQGKRGVMRFGLDGQKDATLGELAPPSFTHDGKMAMFVKDGDVWIAEMDWMEFAFKNERQVTKYGKFNAPFFAANSIMGSDKALIVRNQNQILRVNLLTGDVQQIRLPLGDLGKRRSPDGRMLFGDDGQNFYAFDVEAVDATNFPKGRERAVDFQWLSNGQCAFIVAGKGVALYDRTRNAIEEVAALPFPCNKIAGPSPDGRYVLCAGGQGIVIVDVKSKKVEKFGTEAQDFGWVSDDTLIYSRDVPDMNVRGTWLRTMGGPGRLISGDPYICGASGGGAVALMSEVNLVLFATRTALFRMKPDGSELQEVAKLTKHVERIQAVEIWGE